MICAVERAREPAVARDEQDPDLPDLLALAAGSAGSGCSPPPRRPCRVIRRIADAYGRSDAMRCSARRSRAAEIISIARVIFWTFLTDATRLLSSFSAMG